MRLVPVIMIWILMGMFACSSSTNAPKDSGSFDTTSDVAKDDSTSDAGDIQPDTAQCTTGVDWECLNNDSTLRTCEGGMWVTVNCYEEDGKFCDD